MNCHRCYKPLLSASPSTTLYLTDTKRFICICARCSQSLGPAAAQIINAEEALHPEIQLIHGAATPVYRPEEGTE